MFGTEISKNVSQSGEIILGSDQQVFSGTHFLDHLVVTRL